MALVLKDRVQETTTTTGTGTITLAGAVSGFQSFSAIGNGNTCYYAIVGGTEWEVGLGTYTSSGTTLSRDTILESSNGGTAVNFSAGTKNVFVTYPAEKSIYQNASGVVNLTSTDVTTALGYTPVTDARTLTVNGTTYDLTANRTWSVGTVTSASVVSANGFAGTVATATSTPAITLTTTITGLLKGNGTAISAASSGTDYAPATSGSSILYGNGSGGFSNVTVGTGLSFSTGTLSNSGVTSYPGAGIANSTGSAWGTSYTTSGSGTVVALATSPTLTTATTSGTFTLGGALDETVYAVVDAAGVALTPQNGTIQTWTLGASRTPTSGTWNAGESMTLMINDGTAYTVTWTTLAVTWVGGSAPTLATTGFTVIELWKVGTTIYGALVGTVA